MPLVIGVDETEGSVGPNNDEITDHWLVVYGYDYDSKGNMMLYYYESASGHEFKQQSDKNILNWNGECFCGSCVHNRSKLDKYYVTQLRY